MKPTKHIADPSPRSPSAVFADRGYRTIVNDLSWGHHGRRVYLVVLHTGTETHWATNYDASLCDYPTNWAQVVPTFVQRVEYRKI